MLISPSQQWVRVEVKNCVQLGWQVANSSLSCTCICITNHLFSLTDTAASASAIFLQSCQLSRSDSQRQTTCHNVQLSTSLPADKYSS